MKYRRLKNDEVIKYDDEFITTLFCDAYVDVNNSTDWMRCQRSIGSTPATAFATNRIYRRLITETQSPIKYRLLEVGQTILEGDEYTENGSDWKVIDNNHCFIKGKQKYYPSKSKSTVSLVRRQIKEVSFKRGDIVKCKLLLRHINNITLYYLCTMNSINGYTTGVIIDYEYDTKFNKNDTNKPVVGTHQSFKNIDAELVSDLRLILTDE